MRVLPDLTTATLSATLYKYMVLHLLFPLHSWHCYVQTESNTLCARGIGGKRLFEGMPDFVRALNEATEVKMT
jgi:hypothetical protein